MAEHSAKVSKIKTLSPFWIIPIITAVIGCILLVTHFQNAGHPIIITAENADGIVAGKTTIKNRSVDVGIVNSVELSQKFDHVLLHCTIDKKMRSILKPDTIFWVARPRISATEVSGLSTIIAGVHIEVRPGKKEGEGGSKYTMRNAPPVTADEPGLRVVLNSTLPNVLAVNTPVHFSGYTVGHVEVADFDVENRRMRYRAFIRAPYDVLVTENTRFWQKSGIDLSVTSSGLNVQFPSLSELISGGISFDLPKRMPAGEKAFDDKEYELYPDEKSINEIRYTKYREYLMLFDTSIGGLESGAPVLFRGVRIGTVVEAPFIKDNIMAGLAYSIPVLIRIEPERVMDNNVNFDDMDLFFLELKIRGTLKAMNLLTMSLYVDLDLYPDAPDWKGATEVDGYTVIPTIPGGFEQIQQKLLSTLNRISELPIEPALEELTKALQEARSVAETLNKYLDNENARQLPLNIQRALGQLENVLRNMQPLLDTLNNSSNALIFKVDTKPDIEPKAE